MQGRRKEIQQVDGEHTLLQNFSGQVILPGDDAYDSARTILLGQFNRRPGVIFRPADEVDIARVVTYALENDLELAIRSGGHSMAGHSASEGGIVLDLKNMRAMEIDPASRTAWAGSGLTAGEYTRAAAVQGLVTGFGDTPSVGIGGITLGGGVGYLVRRNGMTIDELLAAEIVTSDGKLVYTDEHSHPDLFWAIRGGGGNFGVVTRFKFKMHAIDNVLAGMLILPATAEVAERIIQESELAPDDLSSIISIMPAPPMPFLPAEVIGKPVILAMMMYSGSSISDGQKALAPFRSIAKPLADKIRPMHYPEIYPQDEEITHPFVIGRSLFINSVDTNNAQTMIDYVKESDAAMRIVQLRVLGGAMARVPEQATAFAHRKARIMVNIISFYSDEHDRLQREKWAGNLQNALQQGYKGAYVNFLGESSHEKIREAYTEECWQKLVSIKKKYDPTNLFRMNHNIPPQ